VSRFVGLIGVVVILGICWLISTDRRAIRWRTVAWGITLQVVFAVVILKTGPGKILFEWGRAIVNRLLSFTDAGASFLFGNLYRSTPEIAKSLGPGAMQGYVQVTDSATGKLVELGVIFAIHVLPTIIFFSALMSVLYHLGIMQRIVAGAAWVMQKTMKTSGSETLSTAANIFVGQTEAPLMVRPFVSSMTISELMAIMVGGFATVAGGVMAAYVRFGIDAGHLLTASVMSAPAALTLAKIAVPETAESQTAGYVKLEVEKDTVNVIDAAASGAATGLKLAANVGAMLIAFIALIALINYILLKVSHPLVGPLPFLNDLSLAKIFGWVFAPMAWVMGVPWHDAPAVGNLIGTKLAVNEFLAYIQLGSIQQQISDKAYVIAIYALCGFANLSSIAIQIGGIGGMAPERRHDLARLGLKAMIVGALASALTATLAGMLL
jgi:CNT family concentrative nucleoside transporter